MKGVSKSCNYFASADAFFVIYRGLLLNIDAVSCDIDGFLHHLHKIEEGYQRVITLFVVYAVKDYFTLSAACAAAKRAIGTRKGEQLT